MLKLIIPIISISFLVGCSTSKDQMFPHTEETIASVWAKKLPNANINDARLQLRRNVDDLERIDEYSSYTRNAKNEIDSQFQRLPNPDLIMFIYPHFSSNNGGSPVPGYSTIFSFFDKTHYAMPGERVKEY